MTLLSFTLQGFFSRNFNITLKKVKTKITTENCETKMCLFHEKCMTTINYISLFLHYICAKSVFTTIFLKMLELAISFRLEDVAPLKAKDRCPVFILHLGRLKSFLYILCVSVVV